MSPAGRPKGSFRGAQHGGTSVSRQSGFTLVEVMVALAIVAVALGAGLRAAASLTDNAARLEQVLAAQWCAENQLTLMRLTRAQPGSGSADIRCEQYGHVFTGTVSTRPTLNPRMRIVDVAFNDEA